jgi:DNA-binding transcriptional ArsR family regulator
MSLPRRLLLESLDDVACSCDRNGVLLIVVAVVAPQVGIALERGTAETVLTDRRLELVDVIRATEPASITDLADDIERDVAAVHRDLDTLFEVGVIAYEADGGRKRPRLKHEHVFVEPIV